ncbi:hypothetical protein FGRMN_2128 [Fusarium graminum]|nr:hypothetical protein FGRMN_2128 [Fusarium graminum]
MSAQIRETLVELGSGNVDYLHAIDSAISHVTDISEIERIDGLTRPFSSTSAPMVDLMTPDIEQHVATLRQQHEQATSKSTYVREHLGEVGTDFLVIDLTFQLAIRLFFGQNMISWEPTTGTLFHAGCPDAMQRATSAVNALCEVLSYSWAVGVPKPEFLSDMVFFGRPSPPIFAQTNSFGVKMTVNDLVHLMSDTKSHIPLEKNTSLFLSLEDRKNGLRLL